MSQENQELEKEPAAEVQTPQEQDELTKARGELNEYKDKYFRALAEAENMRKRLQKEKLDSQTYAIQDVILDFLQPLDHFERALNASQGASEEVKNWAVGFQMILAQCKQILQDNGVVPFDVVGKPFDPHMHEAIETEETTAVAEGIIMEEFIRGYKMATRIIRPAKVKVAVAPASPEQNANQTEPASS
jgi:molecular chaperone GrpE